MKRFFSALVFLLIFPTPVSAHLVGQPPFFRINGVYSNLYPVPTTSLSDFILPQDLAANNYLINQDLSFVMETGLLPVPAQIVNETKFAWDFGDGTKGSGLKNSHTYSKPGSYILSITAQYQSEDPQIIQSVLMNILPSSDYQLPKAVIMVNRSTSKDPLTDVLKFNLKQALNFDAAGSTSKSSKIVSYFWDFGDVNSSPDAVTNHTYTRDMGQVFPVLRVKDANGFIADSFVELENDSSIKNPIVNVQKKIVSDNSLLKYIAMGGGLTVIILLVLLKKFY